jgi:hypothetical protein
MDIQKFLIDALQKRFSANATVRALTKKIEQIAERTTLEKYKGKVLTVDGLEFELGAVNANFYDMPHLLSLSEIDLSLGYFCTSKLPKAKREKLEKVKSNYKRKRFMPWNKYKVPIWYELKFSIDLESVLSGNINLKIELI